MADIEDIEEMIASTRKFIIADKGVAAGIRTFDGISELLAEVIRELRRLNENVEQLRSDNAHRT
ncbi:hypothetical protein [Arvimicrobium flavum]|uniref:hypothetical protein n=1 Tax=Arvimicrobium flavum TaxID=3393320 RepID=UPI00237B5259|nr:hypothetical protein [Mesorhizobium shangrilense]